MSQDDTHNTEQDTQPHTMANTANVGNAFATGRSSWPGISLDEARFAQRIATMGIEPQTLEQRAGDIYLAIACVESDPVALGFFERTFLGAVSRQLGRVVLSPEEEDELRQRLRIKLLVGPMAKIREYKANGPLGAWVRVCALRLALDLTAAPEVLKKNDTQALDTLMAATTGGEVLLDAERHREPFHAALQEALAALTTKDKTILRLHFLDGMNIDSLGLMFQVHRATVARWLVAIRTGVLQHVRQRLALDFGTSASEAQSLVRLLGADVQLSIQRILGPGSL
jgi:RNA polymerase sigma-70 factor (ECF subfamily)